MQIKKTNNIEENNVSKETLHMETEQHRNDVFRLMSLFAFELMETGYRHDWTKIKYIDKFHEDVKQRKDEQDFKKRPWYQIHTKEERHHLHAKVPKDVDLIDVIEYICDSVVAGLARSGSVKMKYLDISDEILQKAYQNTIEKLIKEIEVEE